MPRRRRRRRWARRTRSWWAPTPTTQAEAEEAPEAQATPETEVEEEAEAEEEVVAGRAPGEGNLLGVMQLVSVTAESSEFTYQDYELASERAGVANVVELLELRGDDLRWANCYFGGVGLVPLFSDMVGLLSNHPELTPLYSGLRS